MCVCNIIIPCPFSVATLLKRLSVTVPNAYFGEQSDGKNQIPSPVWVGGSQRSRSQQQKCPVPRAELSPWPPAAPLLPSSTEPTPRTSHTDDNLAKFQPLLGIVHTGIDDVPPCCWVSFAWSLSQLIVNVLFQNNREFDSL